MFSRRWSLYMTVDCAFQGKKSIANPWVHEKYKGVSLRKEDTQGQKEPGRPVESRSSRVKIFKICDAFNSFLPPPPPPHPFGTVGVAPGAVVVMTTFKYLCIPTVVKNCISIDKSM